MRNSYTLLGILFLILIIGSWYAFNRSSKERDTNITSTRMEKTISLTSRAFENGGKIPPRYTCDGENISPSIEWSGVPKGAKSLVLIVDDPDIPDAVKNPAMQEFDHWILFNIPPETTGVAEKSLLGTSGANSAGEVTYTGPCPPPQYKPNEHRYFFRLYALDTELSLKEGASKAEILAAMTGHIIGEGELMGKYRRVEEES